MTAGLVYFQFSSHLKERAEQMMQTRLSDMLDLLTHVEKAVGFLARVNDASTTDRAQGLAEILQLNPLSFTIKSRFKAYVIALVPNSLPSRTNMALWKQLYQIAWWDKICKKKIILSQLSH